MARESASEEDFWNNDGVSGPLPGRTAPADRTKGRTFCSSLREEGHGKIQRVQLDGELNPGNSGGSVVDGEL